MSTRNVTVPVRRPAQVHLQVRILTHLRQVLYGLLVPTVPVILYMLGRAAVVPLMVWMLVLLTEAVRNAVTESIN